MRYRYYNPETATYSEWTSCEDTEPEKLAKSLGYKFIGMADFNYFYINDNGMELIINKGVKYDDIIQSISCVYGC